jgi:hypothetical protein
MRHLADLLDIPTHARVRWCLTPEDCTPEILRDSIYRVSPQFLLIEEEHIDAWARVAHTLCGGQMSVAELKSVYTQEILLTHWRQEEQFRTSPVEGEIWVVDEYSMKEECVESVKYYVSPHEMARRCALVGGHFVLYGGGVHIRGDSRGWRRLCRCGHVLCPLHGLARPNRPRWYGLFSPELWPYVGVVPGSRWHPAPRR